MKIDGFECDNCSATHYSSPVIVGALPPEWFTLTKGSNGLVERDKHFCSLECLINWTSLQTVDMRKIDLGGIEVKVNESMLRKESSK